MRPRRKIAQRINFADQHAWKRENAPLGKLLGYPDCCIEEFCINSPMYLKTNKAQAKDFLRYKASFLNGVYTGFLPCYKHAIQILDKKILIQDLIQNRSQDLLPFPLAFPIDLKSE